jgi:hypothetical protein
VYDRQVLARRTLHEEAEMRVTGLVQLRSGGGDAIMGAVSRRLFVFRYLRVDNATALSAKDPAHPTKMQGTILIPKVNVAYIQAAVLPIPVESKE